MTHTGTVDLPLVSLQDVAVRFGDRAALADLTLDLPAGGISVIVGPNGAGKTTLLRLFAGALEPNSGQMTWPSTTSRVRTALVAQAVALYPFLTLRENCLAAGRMDGVRGAALAAKAEMAIRCTNCAGMENELAGHLSGGYQRRAAIAAALMGDAPLVILDEPTTGLDAASTEAIVAVLQGLRQAGKTIVLTTHDFALADATADLALFLRKGRLRAAGSPTHLCGRLFSGKKHIEVSLTQEPTPSQAELLVTMAGSRLATRRYGLFSELDANGCPSAIQKLHESGIVARDMRIREPGVATLFQRFCLDENAP